MGKRGPKQKPTAMLVSDRYAEERGDFEVDPILTPLSCPEYLTREYEQDAWKFYATLGAGQGIIADGDQVALALVCASYADWLEAREHLSKSGSVYTTTNAVGEEVHHKHPMQDIHDQAWKRLLTSLSHFGWTPSTRPDVPRVTKKESSPMKKLQEAFGE